MKGVVHRKKGRPFKVLLRLMLAWGFSLFIFTTFSCNNLFDSPFEDEVSSDNNDQNIEDVPELQKLNKGGITITLENRQQNNRQRTILPDVDPSNLTSITLSGTKSGDNAMQTLASWNSLSELSGDTVALDVGSWNLELTANNNSFLFCDSRNVNIVLGQSQNVNFILNTSATGGGIDFKISFSNNAQKLEYTLYKYESGTFTSVDSNPNATINTEGSGRSFTYQRNSSNPLDVGIYRLYLKFFADAEKTVLLNTYSEIINVSAGFVSRSTNKTINLNQMYTISYHDVLTGCSIFDSAGNSTTLPEKYSMHTGEITLPELSKTGFIFEGWYTKDSAGNFSSSPVTSISATESGDKEFWAVFNIELKEGSDFNSTIRSFGNVERFVPSVTAPSSSVTISQYLDTGTSVPVWYDSDDGSLKFFADGYTNGTKKLLLRPDSNSLFMNCTHLKLADLTVFDSSRTTDMSQAFFADSSLERVYVSSAFTTAAVTSSTNMFSGCSSQLKGENNFTWSGSNAADKTYARIDSAGTPGYFCSVPATPIYFIIYDCGTNPNGVNVASNPSSYTASQLPISLGNPSRFKTLTGSLAGNYNFEGWYESSDFSTPAVSSIESGRSGNITLYAKWQVPYVIDHKLQNVEDDDYTHHGYGIDHGYAGANTAATPFSGTTLPAGFELKSGDPVAVTINDDGTTIAPVRYNRKNITLTYELNGGNAGGSTADLTRTGKYGAAISSLGTLENLGRTLSGWQDSAGNAVTLPSTFPTENQTYTAQWTTNGYSITLHENGGTIGASPVIPLSYNVDSATIYLPGESAGPTVTKEGHTFAGWFASSTLAGEVEHSIASGSTGAKEFWAKWTVNQYTVTYAAGASDASISIPSSSTHNYGTTVTPAWTATRAGYTFAGWLYDGVTYSNESGGTSSFSMPAANITLTAQWTANTNTPYTIKHYQQNINDDDYTLSDTDNLTGTTDTPVTPEAKTYTGFNVFTSISDITITGDGNAEFSIYYNRKVHTVSYSNGVSGSTISVPTGMDEVRYGTSISPVFTGIGARTGYTFAGWKSGTTIWTEGGGQDPLIMPDSNVTFTAQWNVNSYTVSYLPGATDSTIVLPPDSVHNYNTTVNVDFAASRTAYDFVKWTRGSYNYASTGTTTFLMPASDVELTAVWSPISYDITYVLNGGTNSTSNPATYNIESNITLAAPTRSDGDYRFDGWFTDLDDPSTKVEGFSPGAYGEITLKAKWTPLYAKINGVKKYTKEDTLTAIGDASGAITIELQSVVPADDIGVYTTEGTIAYTIAQKTSDEATTGISLSAAAGAGGEKIALTNCKELFRNCRKLTSVDMTNFDTSAVEDMTSMFYNCENLATLTLTGFSTAAATKMPKMFYSCKALTSLNLSSFNTANVTDMNSMFSGCQTLSALTFGDNFNTNNVTDMSGMFYNCKALTGLNLSFFNTANVKFMNQMFASCESLATLNVSSFDTSSVLWMNSMFNSCKALASLDLSNFDTSKVSDFQTMFTSCESLTSLDVSGFNTAKVEKMDGMFSGCKELTSLDLSNFNTSKVYTLQSMFKDCTNLSSVNLTSFDTRKVQYMTYMFYKCSALTTLNLSSFSSNLLSDVASMFYQCSSLTTITVSPTFSIASITQASKKSFMFKDCTSLVGGWAVDAEKTVYNDTPYAGIGSDDSAYARIDGGLSAPGYFTCCIGTKGKPYAVGDIIFNDGSAMPYADYATLTTEEQDAVKLYSIALIFYVGTELNNGDDTTTSRTLGVGIVCDSSKDFADTHTEAYHKDISTIHCIPSTNNAGTATFDDPEGHVRNGKNNLSLIGEFLRSIGKTDDTDEEGRFESFYYGINYKEKYFYEESSSRVAGSAFENGWYFPSLAEVCKLYINGYGGAKLFDAIAAINSLGGGASTYGDYSIKTSTQVKGYENRYNAYEVKVTDGTIKTYDKNVSGDVTRVIREF